MQTKMKMFMNALSDIEYKFMEMFFFCSPRDFAHRDPTPTVNELLNVTWHPYDTEAVGRGFMNINLTMSFDKEVTREGGDFQLWQAIYKCFYESVCNRLHEYLFENKIVDD